jgi:hypothetical protein
MVLVLPTTSGAAGLDLRPLEAGSKWMDPRAVFPLPFPQRMMRVSMVAIRVRLVVYVVCDV